MLIVRFKIHSFIDVITNSSTEVFVISKEKLKENLFEIIESLKFIANSDVDIREIFEIGVSDDGGGVSIYTKDECYSEEEDYRSDFYKKNPDMSKKIKKSMEALFSLESVDNY